MATSNPTEAGRDPRARRVSRKPHEYRTRDVVDLLGISRRQLQYWAQTDLLVPSATTPGGHRRYSFEDLVASGVIQFKLKLNQERPGAGGGLTSMGRSLSDCRSYQG